MYQIFLSGGWLMWPILVCSIVAVAIIGERLWALQKKNIAPAGLAVQVQQLVERRELDRDRIVHIYQSSPLGRVLAAGLINRQHPREIVKEAIEDAGRHVAPELERYLNALGTIAAISPFLGLLGTVLGMIDMFGGIGSHGLGDPTIVAAGISQALVATASGLAVAIPSLMFYRYFRARVDALLIDMEKEALRLVEILHGQRERA